MKIEDTLIDRGKKYGNFLDHAYITQSIKLIIHNTDSWDTLSCDQQEALDMIAHKIGRILNGDSEYKDSWHDIVVYAKLVDDSLEE
jgi:hypothetical protein